jgi:hypothetical protein
VALLEEATGEVGEGVGEREFLHRRLGVGGEEG